MSTLFLKIGRNKAKNRYYYSIRVRFDQKLLKKTVIYGSITFETMPHNTHEVIFYDEHYERKRYEKNCGIEQALHLYDYDSDGVDDGYARRKISYYKLLLR